MSIMDIFKSKTMKPKRSSIREGESLWCGTCSHQWRYNRQTDIRRCPECGNVAWKYAVEPVDYE